jgi:Tol biopolymer transport system component
MSLPTAVVPIAAPPPAPNPSALVTAALALQGVTRSEEVPVIIATAFPGMSPEQLPAAIQQGLQSGQIKPELARVFVDALFPGVPPGQLAGALAGSFAGFNQQQIEQLLKTIYPGQNIVIPKINIGSGQVVFAALDDGGQRIHIYQMNADGSGKKLLIEDASEPAFSPDGVRLVYVSWRADARGLRIRDLTSGADRQLTGISEDAYPSWAPSGQRVAFWNTRDNAVLTINVDGTDRRLVTRGEFPAWSPQGDRIAIKGCVSNDCGIVLVNPDGSNPVRITTNANDGQPAWSPDGRNIAFVSNRDGNWEIYAVNANGAWLRRVTFDPHTDGLPAWAADGIRIAFRSDRSGVWAIYTATGVGGPAFKLTDAPVQTSGEWQWTREKISWRQ